MATIISLTRREKAEGKPVEEMAAARLWKRLQNLLRHSSVLWVIVITQYVVWHLCNYIVHSNVELYQAWYYINERLFAVLVFLLLSKLMKAQFIKFRLIAKTLVWIAISKLVYMCAILLRIVSENETISIFFLLIITLTGIIIIKWPKYSS